MMEFSDLKDDIEADDWLVPSGEILCKRLIKRTPRYNIYKADWYGDVLVYEPVRRHQETFSSRDDSSAVQRHDLPALEAEQSQQYLNSNSVQQASRRLFHEDEHEEKNLSSIEHNNELYLNLSCLSSVLTPELARSQLSLASDCDSAYSSTLSTPQYRTENEDQSEFRFPDSQSPNHLLDNQTNFHDNTQTEVGEKLEQRVQADGLTIGALSPVVLNRDSYLFFAHCPSTNQNHHQEISSYCSNCDTNNQLRAHSSWSELNELRLVAHESFMLFMGACVDVADQYDDDNDECLAASLVMQMNHPKSMSLHNLLHANKLASSPLDRFLASKQPLRPQLNLEAKLNICQQVTDAMTYLHDKNIVHGKLTSVNIYIELNQRVNISLIDNDESSIARVRPDKLDCDDGPVEFNLPALTYLSPELIKSISILSKHRAQVKFNTNKLTKMSDVFSFGTLLYEIFEERFPFSRDDEPSRLANVKLSPFNLSPTSPFDTHLKNWNGNISASASQIIFQIGSGQIATQNLNRSTKDKNVLKCPSLVQDIIVACWSQDPELRPRFKQLAFA